jgi:hypothetical protein
MSSRSRLCLLFCYVLVVYLSFFGVTLPSPITHELRNEVEEELISDLTNESCAEREALRVGGSRNWGMESQRGRS